MMLFKRYVVSVWTERERKCLTARHKLWKCRKIHNVGRTSECSSMDPKISPKRKFDIDHRWAIGKTIIPQLLFRIFKPFITSFMAVCMWRIRSDCFLWIVGNSIAMHIIRHSQPTRFGNYYSAIYRENVRQNRNGANVYLYLFNPNQLNLMSFRFKPKQSRIWTSSDHKNHMQSGVFCCYCWFGFMRKMWSTREKKSIHLLIARPHGMKAFTQVTWIENNKLLGHRNVWCVICDVCIDGPYVHYMLDTQ